MNHHLNQNAQYFAASYSQWRFLPHRLPRRFHIRQSFRSALDRKGDLRRQPGWYPDNRLLPPGRFLDSHFWQRQVKAITKVDAIDLAQLLYLNARVDADIRRRNR
jgi:hypothetical protein